MEKCIRFECATMDTSYCATFVDRYADCSCIQTIDMNVDIRSRWQWHRWEWRQTFNTTAINYCGCVSLSVNIVCGVRDDRATSASSELCCMTVKKKTKYLQIPLQLNSNTVAGSKERLSVYILCLYSIYWTSICMRLVIFPKHGPAIVRRTESIAKTFGCINKYNNNNTFWLVCDMLHAHIW